MWSALLLRWLNSTKLAVACTCVGQNTPHRTASPAGNAMGALMKDMYSKGHAQCDP